MQARLELERSGQARQVRPELRARLEPQEQRAPQALQVQHSAVQLAQQALQVPHQALPIQQAAQPAPSG